MRVIEIELDCTQLDCPMPLLKAKQAIARIKVGQILRVKTADVSSLEEFGLWTQSLGLELLETKLSTHFCLYRIRKSR